MTGKSLHATDSCYFSSLDVNLSPVSESFLPHSFSEQKTFEVTKSLSILVSYLVPWTWLTVLSFSSSQGRYYLTLLC